jgi:hypothetical protein
VVKLLVRERSELTAELEAAPAAENVVALHPATLAGYEQQLARPQEALGKAYAISSKRSQFIAIFRSPAA